jgi:DNA gyrase/topoisomerase IV subunit A
MLAINGSEGVSIGFAQKILPRNPKEIPKVGQATCN